MGRVYDINFWKAQQVIVLKYLLDEKLALNCKQFNKLTVLFSRYFLEQKARLFLFGLSSNI